MATRIFHRRTTTFYFIHEIVIFGASRAISWLEQRSKRHAIEILTTTLVALGFREITALLKAVLKVPVFQLPFHLGEKLFLRKETIGAFQRKTLSRLGKKGEFTSE